MTKPEPEPKRAMVRRQRRLCPERWAAVVAVAAIVAVAVVVAVAAVVAVAVVVAVAAVVGTAMVAWQGRGSGREGDGVEGRGGEEGLRVASKVTTYNSYMCGTAPL